MDARDQIALHITQVVIQTKPEVLENDDLATDRIDRALKIFEEARRQVNERFQYSDFE